MSEGENLENYWEVERITMDADLENACNLVERYLRTLGKEVTVTVTPRFVEIADASWPGSSAAQTLADALEDALK